MNISKIKKEDDFMDMKTKEEYLRKSFQFFKDLSLKEIKFILDSSNVVKYKKGELIQSKNKLCTGIVVVVDGFVRSFMSSAGREITLFRMFEYDVCMLSSSCAYKNLQYDISVEAEEDSEVIIIDSESFKKLSDSNLLVQNFMFELIQGKMSDVLLTLEQAVFFSIESRLCSYLLDLYYIKKSDKIDITHEKIANNLGTAREVVSRSLKKLEKDNLVFSKRGSIEILDLELLKEKI